MRWGWIAVLLALSFILHMRVRAASRPPIVYTLATEALLTPSTKNAGIYLVGTGVAIGVAEGTPVDMRLREQSGRRVTLLIRIEE